MGFLDSIVSIINTPVNDWAVTHVIGVKTSGIAISLQSRSTDFEGLLPCVADHFDDPIYCGVDDQYGFVSYHKVTGRNRRLIKESSYGASIGMIEDIAQMQLHVWADRRKLKMTAETLDEMIVSKMPVNLTKTQLSSLGLKYVEIVPAGTNYDSTAIFASEYRTDGNRLPSNSILIVISYQVTSRYNKDCDPPCQNC